MSLVAYAASSDEESENEEESSGAHVEFLRPTTSIDCNKNGMLSGIPKGHISDDDDDDYIPQDVSLQELKPTHGRLSLSLPKPKIKSASTDEKPGKGAGKQADDAQVTQAFARLPTPRTASAGRPIIEEVDDEFLHKKAVTAAAGTINLEKPPPSVAKARVKIIIPSLRDFADVNKEQAAKSLSRQTQAKSEKGCGLLSILPQAKSERDFGKKTETDSIKTLKRAAPKITATASFVPDTVKQRRAAHNTEGVDGVKAPPGKQTTLKKPSKPVAALVSVSDSEGDDDGDDSGDFFSLHSEQKLPEVSSNEINALVAKRAAKMVEASNKYLAVAKELADATAETELLQSEELQLAQKRYHDQQLNAEAMDALVGKNAKRRRKEAKEMQVIEISGSQVMPNREEWMRTALASETSYQATGVLTDEEPVAGTRRKHQITYLAHMAKANEAELQAMWSANRQTRRATQSKYGF